MLKIGFLQFEPQFADVAGNLNTVMNMLETVEADLMVLPELAFTGYAFNNRAELESLAENPYESDITEALFSLCIRKKMHIVAGFAEKDGGKCFNSSLLIGLAGLEMIYRKLHLFNTEKNYFDPGNRPPAVWPVGGAMIGMMICFDWIFPEMARTLALRGADIICHPANLVIPEKCQYSMVTRCVENRIYAVTANRFGTERGVSFTGGSQIVSPDGEILHRAPAAHEEVATVDIDVGLAHRKMITLRNDIFEDRRPEFYFG